MTKFKNPTRPIDRRTILKGGLGAGLALGVSPISTVAQDDPAAARRKTGDSLGRVEDETLKSRRPEDIQTGMPQLLAWPMDPVARIVRRASRLNRVMLLRLDESQLV